MHPVGAAILLPGLPLGVTPEGGSFLRSSNQLDHDLGEVDLGKTLLARTTNSLEILGGV
jgi:hypothetical protein